MKIRCNIFIGLQNVNLMLIIFSKTFPILSESNIFSRFAAHKFVMKIKFFILFINLIPILLFAQTDQEKKYISKIIWDLSIQPTGSFSESYNYGKKMLSLSKNDFERAKSYGHIGDALMKQMKYSEALENLQEADRYAENSKYITEQIMINHIMQYTYVKMGLYNEAEIKLRKAKTLADKIQMHDYNILSDLSYALIYESKGDYCKAISYREKYYKITQDAKKELITPSESIGENLNIYANFTILAYNYIKCQQFDKALLSINQAELYHKKEKFIDHQQNALFYLCKALIAEKQQQSKEAISWIAKAEKSAKQWKNSFILNRIAEEKFLNKISDKNSLEQDFQAYKETTELKQKEILQLTNKELSNKTNLLNKEYNLVNLLLLLLFFILIGSGVIIFLLRKRKRKMLIRFERIIKDLENSHPIQTNEDLNSIDQTNEKNRPHFSSNIKSKKEEESKLMSAEKEREILENLQRFESGQKYRTSGFTLSNLTTILKTNTNYTNYILKHHRGKSFSDYINSLRIQFVIEKLYENPEFLNYKLSYISELSGFSSHSKFTQAFKKEAQMPPSDFIRMIQMKNEKKELIS